MSRSFMIKMSYQEFAPEFIKASKEHGVASLIVNWQDAPPFCQLLDTYGIAMRGEFADEAYDDIENVRTYDGNMLITLFENNELICEKALDDDTAYVAEVPYFVEKAAGDVCLPVGAKIVQFEATDIFDGVF